MFNFTHSVIKLATYYLFCTVPKSDSQIISNFYPLRGKLKKLLLIISITVLIYPCQKTFLNKHEKFLPRRSDVSSSGPARLITAIA